MRAMAQENPIKPCEESQLTLAFIDLVLLHRLEGAVALAGIFGTQHRLTHIAYINIDANDEARKL